MTIGKLCCALVTTLLVATIGCGGDVQDQNQSLGEDESQTSQAVTGCELDCPGGQVFTCATTPCSVTATSLTCNGTVTTCPSNACDADGGICGMSSLQCHTKGGITIFASCAPSTGVCCLI